MLRILTFFLLVLAAGIGFGWLADNPGTASFVWQGRQLETSLMVFIIALAVLILAVLLVVWLVRLFFKTPDRIGNWWSGRRRDKGYEALSSGIIAAGAGDSVLARRMTKRSEKYLRSRDEPLIRFLDAQTAMIEGDHGRARSAFEQMERDPQTRLLALRGLFLEAERTGDDAGARLYAERAVRIAPHVPWAGGAVLEAKAIEGDFDGALAILDAQKNSRLVDRHESQRLRAVLLTAKAMGIAESDPSAAKSAAIEAHKLAPDLTPAAVVAAKALFRLGDLRKGSKILEEAWLNAPHPEIAETYVHARPGDSVSDRMKRAQKLHDIRPTHVESSLAVAHAAFDARDLERARAETLAVIDKEPRESAFLLLADIDEERGEVGRVREWLARAIRAPRDPVWTADGVVSETWAPVSPVTGRLDAFHWKVPVDRVGGPGPMIEARPGDDAKPVGASPASAVGSDAGATPVTVPLGASVVGGIERSGGGMAGVDDAASGNARAPAGEGTPAPFGSESRPAANQAGGPAPNGYGAGQPRSSNLETLPSGSAASPVRADAAETPGAEVANDDGQSKLKRAFGQTSDGRDERKEAGLR